jgi:subtilisin family serine protease
MPSGLIFLNSDIKKEEPASRLIVTIRRTPRSDSALTDIREAAQFGCNFEGMLEDRLEGLESAAKLPELDHRFAILTLAQSDGFYAANRILARHGGPDGSVIAVEPDALLRFSMPSVGAHFRLSGQHAQYCSKMDVDTAHQSTTGKGVRVAVVDTGADLKSANDFYDVLDLSGRHPGLPSQDKDGHGTAMAMLIRDIAPDAEIFVVRVANQAQATVVDAMAAVSVAMVDCQADIINLSLGFPGFGNVCSFCGSSGTSRHIAFETLLRSLSKTNPGIYVAAAGNDAPKQTEFE